ncbi:S8 family peptidase [Croceitalea marina]|uniref:S8 family peptidase n=1 Tax=Croceitalea marina TaxID=1775166 RepID=A0ABW5N0J8_9FLAO
MQKRAILRLSILILFFCGLMESISQEKLPFKGFKGGLQIAKDKYNLPNRYAENIFYTLSKNRNVFFLEHKIPKTETPISAADLSVNAITNAHAVFPNANGANVSVSIKELLFNVNDIDYSERVSLNGNEANTLDQHATAMATIVGGNGNSGPKGLGVAPNTQLSSSSFLKLLPDDSQQLITDGIFVQNHSYGVSIENFYGDEASAYDEQIFVLQDMVHVFSVGNSGTEVAVDGPYANLESFATLTGNFKQAKNVITVGATDALDNISERSSKGPSFDGRVKPDLVAYAPGGTSDAAALVSGTVASIQDLYFKKNGAIPSYPLVKSSLIAGTEDAGVSNIDYESGYGKLNAKNSLQIIDNGQFFEGTMAANGQTNNSITVPENTKSLKIALSWLDTESIAGSTDLLNNDLDLVVNGPNSNEYLPWILSSSANADSLKRQALRGIDNLNTLEFITIENPFPGTYGINISADSENTTEVPYAVSYSLENSGIFEWQFPLKNETLSNLGLPVLRWKNTTALNVGSLSYRVEGGEWVLISNTIDLNNQLYQWEIPELNEVVELQMVSGTQVYTSDKFFVSQEIIPQVEYNCPDEVGISWESVSNAIAYEVKTYTNNSLQVIATVSEPFFVNQKAENGSVYFSVTPIFNDGKGLRSNTINIEDSGVQCYFRGFIALLNDDNEVDLALSLSTGINIERIDFVKTIAGQDFIINSYSDGFEDLVVTDTDSILVPGNNRYRAEIILANGNIVQTDEVELFIPDKNELILFPNPIENGFDLNFTSQGSKFQILDMTGKVIVQDSVLSIQDFIGINLSAGIYIFHMVDENNKTIAAKKLIVK